MGNETTAVEFQLSSDDLAYLEAWAQNSARPLDELLTEAVERYILWRREFIAAVEECLTAPAVSHEEMLAIRAEQRRAFLESRH